MGGMCDGRMVVITGAARGVVRAHTLAFAEGAKVVVNDLGAEQQAFPAKPADLTA